MTSIENITFERIIPLRRDFISVKSHATNLLLLRCYKDLALA